MKEEIKVVRYTEDRIPDVIEYELQLRAEEDVWGWEIDEKYKQSVKDSFRDKRFDNSLSLLAYVDGKVAGRIDAVLLPSRFDGSIKAYLDWICVIKSYRHKGVGQALMNELRRLLKDEGIDTLIGLTASNDEAQSFYRAVPDSVMRDTGIWIDIK